MSWMDFKMANAMRAQKVNEDAKRVQVGKTQKGTGEKPTQVADDVLSKHASEAQKLNSYSKSQQLTQQKGTGEKATVVADDLMTRHTTNAQKLNSYSKSEQLGHQKGTGDSFSSGLDQQTEHALKSQKVASYSRAENLAHHKGDASLEANNSPADVVNSEGTAEEEG
ncbi:uncharacterized protein LOC126317486 isoform X2 [Schistocerca gregaria]|uniref:uncharacterized protein LOC126317486 isoform X2 n=1 Tax=Schistocerca gregaria TaxID=7010 RepID=UPI00211E01A5|nr:uncharacterized protein LOC126317486 isoform X2 [Schistocerca gregaria]